MTPEEIRSRKVLKRVTIVLFVILFIILLLYIPYVYLYDRKIFNLDLSLGDKYVLNLLDKNLNYVSSDENIATVDNNGIISINNFGKVKIVVKDKNDKMKYTYNITISDTDQASLDLYPNQLELKTGDTYQLIHKYISKTKPESIVWESSNPSVVTVDQNGIVTGVANGKSTIKLTIDGMEKECVVNVSTVNNPVEPNYVATVEPTPTPEPTPVPEPTPTPTPTPEPKEEPKTDTPQAIITTNKPEEPKEVVVESINSDVKSKNIYVGETYQIVTVINPSNAKTTLTYKSSNTNVATVSNKGVVKGIAKGNAIITVTSDNNKTYEVNITVNEIVVKPTKKTFTASIQGNGANVASNSVSCTTTGTKCKVTLPNITRDGYNIIGYSTNQNATSAEYSAGASIDLYGNVTYYAITSRTVVATFLPSEYVSSTKVSCNIYNTNTSCAINTPSIYRANYVSLGFNTDPNASNGISAASISSDTTFYAITRINQEGILAGCTGWAAGNINFYSGPNTSSYQGVLNSGQVFTIEEQVGQFFKVSVPGKSGYKYVLHNYVMINLSDYIPSAVYNITNATSSIYKTSGLDIPGITGTRLYYSDKVYNVRLRRYEYMTPMIYSTANLILAAENRFKNDGYRLKVYDTYRPHSVSVKIYNALKSLYNSNKTVKDNIDYSTGASGTRYYWGPGHFLATGVSRHNLGIAIDATLVNSSGVEVTMPTAMHELSTKAIKYYSGDVAKIPANYSKEMNDIAKYYDGVMTSVGLNTISGEWWHFQENNAANRTKSCDFHPAEVYSY